jgi:hypothetical protein
MTSKPLPEMFRSFHRRVIGCLSVAMMFVGALALPNAVLCMAPGGHFAIELVGGADCSGEMGLSSETPRKRTDGCPSNCRDTHFCNSVQCSKPTSLTPPAVSVTLAAAPTETLSITAFTVDPPFASVRPPAGTLRTIIILC